MTIDTVRRRAQANQWDSLVQDEARIANERQKANPGMTRTTALKHAYDAMREQRRCS